MSDIDIKKFDREELETLDFIPKLNRIDLKSLAEYYSDKLGNKSFKFKIKLKSSKEEMDIDIRFFEENLPHLLGIQKIVENTNLKNQKYKYQGVEGYKRIINNKITIETLKELDRQLRPSNRADKQVRVLPIIEDRITHLYLLPKLMRECKMVKFCAENVSKYHGGSCSIKSDFILYSTEFKVKLQLGVIKEKGSPMYYVPETFIVTAIRNRSVDRLTLGQRYADIIERYEPEIIRK
ncbi:MAG: PBECR4 domain-containing protein [Clostridium sp.]